MYKIFAFVIFSIIGIVLSIKCHVTNDEKELHCGDAINMTCRSSDYIPYCHLINDDPNVQMNGVCSCEKFCFSDFDCSSGCRGSYVGKCVEAYNISIEKICLCKKRI